MKEFIFFKMIKGNIYLVIQVQGIPFIRLSAEGMTL